MARLMTAFWNRLPARQRARALWLPLLALTVALTHTAAPFITFRYKAPSPPVAAQEGTARIAVPASALESLRPPFALILRVTGPGESASPLTVTADGQPVCEARLAPARSARIDCTVTSLTAAPIHELVISAAGTGVEWTLDYLEAGTHFGNATAPNVVFITPGGATFARPPTIFTLLVTALVFGSALLPVPARRRWARRVLATVSALAVFLLLATIATTLVSQFSLVISPGTLIRWLVLAQLSPLVAAARRLFTARQFAWLPAALQAAAVASLVLLAFWSIPRWQLPRIYSNNYSGFLKIQESYFDANPLVATVPGLKQSLRVGDDGYDGEMMWAMAFDPLATRFADNPIAYREVVGINPGYRLGRIGFSLVTALAGRGNAFAFPQTMMWLIGGALWLGAMALALLAQRAGKSAAFGFLILLVPGFWVSIQTGLPEPLAAAALLWGIFLIETGLFVPGALCLGYSLLVRETGAIAVLWIVIYCWRTRGRRSGLTVAAFGLLPVALWRGYLAVMLWPAFGPAGVIFKSPSDVPLRGIVQTWQHVLSGEYWPHVWQLGFAARAFSVLLILVAIASLLWIGRGALAIGSVACAYALNALMLDFPAVWAHVWNTERTTFELFVITAVVFATASLSRLQQRVAIALFALCAVHLTISALDAQLIRDTVVDMLIAS